MNTKSKCKICGFLFFTIMTTGIVAANPDICEHCHEKIKAAPHAQENDYRPTNTQFFASSIQVSASDTTVTTTQPPFTS